MTAYNDSKNEKNTLFIETFLFSPNYFVFYILYFAFILSLVFTGIIESTAKVLKRKNEKLVLSRPKIFKKLQKGQSLSVNGACLSVVNFDATRIQFDVVPETYAKTNLENAQIVNIERAMPANGRFEGHIVLGHVDAVTPLLERKKESTGEKFLFSLPKELNTFFIQKGSVCVNGVSLTISNCNKSTFEIALIPHTLEMTNLGTLKTGDTVNIEADYVTKIIAKKDIQ